jgi:hypothetical protein
MGCMSASDAAPLPRLGEVFFDVRGNSRSMRLSWYADTGVAVFSIWQGGMCTGTFRLPIADLPRMVETLQRGPAGQAHGPDPEAPAQAFAAAPVSAGYRTGQAEYQADKQNGAAGYPPKAAGYADSDQYPPERADYTGAAEYPADYQPRAAGNSREPERHRTGPASHPAEPDGYRTGPAPYVPEPEGYRTGPAPQVPEPESYRNAPAPYVPETETYRSAPAPYVPETETYRSAPAPYVPETETYRSRPAPYVPETETYRNSPAPYVPGADRYRGGSAAYDPDPAGHHAAYLPELDARAAPSDALGARDALDYRGPVPAAHYSRDSSYRDAVASSATDYPAHYRSALTDDSPESLPAESLRYSQPAGNRGAGRHAPPGTSFD